MSKFKPLEPYVPEKFGQKSNHGFGSTRLLVFGDSAPAFRDEDENASESRSAEHACRLRVEDFLCSIKKRLQQETENQHNLESISRLKFWWRFLPVLAKSAGLGCETWRDNGCAAAVWESVAYSLLYPRILPADQSSVSDEEWQAAPDELIRNFSHSIERARPDVVLLLSVQGARALKRAVEALPSDERPKFYDTKLISPGGWAAFKIPMLGGAEPLCGIISHPSWSHFARISEEPWVDFVKKLIRHTQLRAG